MWRGALLTAIFQAMRSGVRDGWVRRAECGGPRALPMTRMPAGRMLCWWPACSVLCRRLACSAGLPPLADEGGAHLENLANLGEHTEHHLARLGEPLREERVRVHLDQVALRAPARGRQSTVNAASTRSVATWQASKCACARGRAHPHTQPHASTPRPPPTAAGMGRQQGLSRAACEARG